VAADLVWANVVSAPKSYGFPYVAGYEETEHALLVENGKRVGRTSNFYEWDWHWGIPVNFFVTLAILTAVAVGCEGWVRRREG